MGRKAKMYTLVFADGGDLDYLTFNNEEDLRQAIVDRSGNTSSGNTRSDNPEPNLLVFVGDPVVFNINRNPTVTIGEPKKRKPRSASPNPPARTDTPKVNADGSPRRKPREEGKPVRPPVDAKNGGTKVGEEFFHKDAE
jgi:hypothetical protein